jgi:hypothetical protein
MRNIARTTNNKLDTNLSLAFEIPAGVGVLQIYCSTFFETKPQNGPLILSVPFSVPVQKVLAGGFRGSKV